MIERNKNYKIHLLFVKILKKKKFSRRKFREETCHRWIGGWLMRVIETYVPVTWLKAPFSRLACRIACQTVTPTNNACIATRASINIHRFIEPESLLILIFHDNLSHEKYRSKTVSWKEKRSIFEKESRGMEMKFLFPRLLGWWLHVLFPDGTTKRENFK